MKKYLLTLSFIIASFAFIEQASALRCVCTAGGAQTLECEELPQCQTNCDCRSGRHCEFPGGTVSSGTPGKCVDNQ